MSKELPYSSHEREEIIQAVAYVDGQMNQATFNSFALYLAKSLGRLNLADLEIIFRENNLLTSLLAVPWTEEMQDDNPETIIANPNNLQEQCPNWALVCATPPDVEYYAGMYEVDDFDPNLNLARLENAGIDIPRPGTATARAANYRLN